MDCRKVMELVLSMDNELDPPADVLAHLVGCEKCRAEFEVMRTAIQGLRIGSEESGIETLEDGAIATEALTARVMEAVRRDAAEFGVRAEQPAPLRNWIIAGTILLVGLFGLRFSDVMNWLRRSFGPALDVAMSVILGLFLTGYIGMLVASNLARVRRVFRLRQP